MMTSGSVLVQCVVGTLGTQRQSPPLHPDPLYLPRLCSSAIFITGMWMAVNAGDGHTA